MVSGMQLTFLRLAVPFFTMALVASNSPLVLPGAEEPVNSANRLPKADEWSIGILTGTSPFVLSPPEGLVNPVLTAADVTDFGADIVAHPFMVITDSMYYMFCTVKFGPSDQGGIGLAESQDGFHWKYRQLVIKEPFVLSYPYVFKWQDDYYLIPEAHTESSVRLYRAQHFPTEWTYVGNLVTGDHFISASVVNFRGRWWMFVSPEGNETLRLFFADTLTGTWTEHPMSPIVTGNKNIARPGGRLLVLDDTLYRMGQDCDPTYGNQVHAFEILDISPTTYREKMVEPALVQATKTGWNASAMHHVDLYAISEGKWIAAVDALGQIPAK